MISFLENHHPVVQALFAGIFTWSLTGLGATAVFLKKTMSQKILDTMLGFAAGIMIAASFWSLLDPAIRMSENSIIAPWFPAALGFLLGAIALKLMDKALPFFNLGFPVNNGVIVNTSFHRTILLVLAITLHNIPEGLAIGVAFGVIGTAGASSTALPAAIALAIGIGIQNIPEGLAVSLPLRREGVSRFKSFWYGQLSGVVEPIASVIGATAVILAKPLLPYALGFAAGAMIFVVVEEVIPESQRNDNADLATAGAILGFLAMMILDVTFS